MPSEDAIGGREWLRLLSCEGGMFREQKPENHKKAHFVFQFCSLDKLLNMCLVLRQVAVCCSYVTCDGAQLSWRWLNSCLPMGSGE